MLPDNVPQEEAGVRPETDPARRDKTGIPPETQPPTVIERENAWHHFALRPEEIQPEHESDNKEQFRDTHEMFEALAAKGLSSEVVQSLEERRWVEATAGPKTLLYSEPRFDTAARWILPGTRYLVIDSHLGCSRTPKFTWKFALVRWSGFEVAKGLVCTPAQVNEGLE